MQSVANFPRDPVRRMSAPAWQTRQHALLVAEAIRYDNATIATSDPTDLRDLAGRNRDVRVVKV